MRNVPRVLCRYRHAFGERLALAQQRVGGGGAGAMEAMAAATADTPRTNGLAQLLPLCESLAKQA